MIHFIKCYYIAQKLDAKIKLVAPLGMILWAIACFIACGFNGYYYIKSGLISNLIGAILCLNVGNQFIRDAIYGVKDDIIIIKGRAISRSCIDNIEMKRVFLFSFLSIAIIHFNNSPRISIYISKKAWDDLKNWKI